MRRFRCIHCGAGARSCIICCRFRARHSIGQRAYKLARAGKTVEMPTRKVQIYSIDIISYETPFLKIRAHVGSGTYIRTLAEDIGQKLGCGAYTTELRRTKIADYDITKLPLFELPK